MPYDPNQPRIPVGSSEGGQWSEKSQPPWTSERLSNIENEARRAAGLAPVRTEFKPGNAADLINGINGLPSHLKGYVTVYTEKEYEKMGAKIYLSEDKLSGFAIKPDGELISVFSSVRGRGNEIAKNAVLNGALHLDCYEHPVTRHLTELYSRYGFKEIKRLKWDDQYAPPGWDFEKNGRPDVVFMERKEE